jgi:SAM-dependent methyltransferase
METYLKSFDFFERYATGGREGDFYVESHTRRFRETLALLPPLPTHAPVLELGAVPYYMTILLKRFFKFDVEPLSFYEPETSTATEHIVESAAYGERFGFKYRAVDVERDEFPFPAASFDLVLCCELLEHLLINPSQMLYEAHRVLKPGGYLLLTTPNVLRWRNVASLARGKNIYDHYHGNGIYGRHNREYTPAEVGELLRANNFTIESLQTRHVYGSRVVNRVPVLFTQRRDNIFALARSTGQARMQCPANLYVLMDQYRNVVRSAIEMGTNEIGQIGRGWHGVETVDKSFRWTEARAMIYLKNAGARQLSFEAWCNHPNVTTEPVTVSLRVNNQFIGSADLTDHMRREISFPFASTFDGAVLECELQVSRTWTPRSDTASTDERELGIAISHVSAA